MVENPVEPGVELIDRVGGKNVRFRNRHVAPVVVDVLGAGEGILFGESGRTAGNERVRLIVAEARKDRILAGELWSSRMSNSPSFSFLHRHVGVVVAERALLALR